MLSASANCRRTPPAEREVEPLASVARSSSATSGTPPAARWNAVLAPTAPPPITTTSARAGRSLTPLILLPRHQHADVRAQRAGHELRRCEHERPAAARGTQHAERPERDPAPVD